MKKYKVIIILLNLALLLLYFNRSVFEKEKLISNGQLILLRLAPVDPRSLMQGDYMNLRYELADSVDLDSLSKRGYCVVKLESNGIAKRVRFQRNITPLHSGEHLIEYTKTNKWNISIGAESYFFEEGQASKFENAVYGAIKVDQHGNSLLVGLYNKALKKIE